MKILRAGTLIDGTGAPPVRDAAVLIDNGRIEAVTTAGPSAGRPPDAEVIDASRFTVLPGLIDCHDHLAFHGYELVRRWGLDEPQSTRQLRTARVVSQVLASGYTAVRDGAGLDAGFRLAIQEGLITGPRLVLSLAIISPIGGSGDRISPSGHESPFLHDPSLPPSVADGIDGARTRFRTMVRAGAGVVKYGTTGGARSRARPGPALASQRTREPGVGGGRQGGGRDRCRGARSSKQRAGARTPGRGRHGPDAGPSSGHAPGGRVPRARAGDRDDREGQVGGPRRRRGRSAARYPRAARRATHQAGDQGRGDRDTSMTGPSARRRKTVALILSGIFPGLGQFYNRQPIKALVFLALGIVLSWLVSRAAPTDADALTRPAAALVVPLCALLAVSLWSVIDAWRTAAR